MSGRVAPSPGLVLLLVQGSRGSSTSCLREVHGGSVDCVSASSPAARDQGGGGGGWGGSTWFRTPGDTDTRAGSGHVLASPRRPLSRAFCRPGARTGRPHTQCLLEFPRCLRFRNFSFASTLLEYCLGEYEEVACHYGESFSEQLGDREQVSPCFKTPPLMSRHAARPPHLEQMLS